MGTNFNSSFTCFDHPQLLIAFPPSPHHPNPPSPITGTEPIFVDSSLWYAVCDRTLL